ncbi:WxcM-like domain-containing protein [Candidatus Micrarchaeota archaeon]|nr:WxcM-like domain-containing protein [Candidatus Micrarchaeota archaeon]
MDAKIGTRMIKRTKHSRDDGYLVELFSKKYDDFKAVHSYLVRVAPGKTRAGHFHKKKTEVIFPVGGEVTIILKEMENAQNQNKSAKEIILSSEKEEYSGLLVPPELWHLIENRTDKDAKIVVFSDSFDLEDTYQLE